MALKPSEPYHHGLVKKKLLSRDKKTTRPRVCSILDFVTVDRHMRDSFPNLLPNLRD